MIPETAITKLRILTKKSKLLFGKYHDFTVHDVLIMNSKYIVWAYYNKELISFSDDILEEFDIIPIKKPGTDKEVYYQWLDNLSAKFTEVQTEHYKLKRYNRKRKKSNVRLANAIRSETYTKGELQSINHGKRDRRYHPSYKQRF